MKMRRTWTDAKKFKNITEWKANCSGPYSFAKKTQFNGGSYRTYD